MRGSNSMPDYKQVFEDFANMVEIINKKRRECLPFSILEEKNGKLQMSH